MIKITKIIILLLFIYFFVILWKNDNPGAIALVGGGKIPKEAINWLKEHSLKNKNLIVIAYNFDIDDYWKEKFKNIKYILPRDFEKISLKNVSAIFIAGGNQWNYINEININYLQKAHNKGIPILGTSAGAMILAEKCFSAEHGSITSEEAIQNKNVCIKDGIMIKCLKNCIIDTHFTERNRKERLKVFIEKSGVNFGIGIDECTALCIKNNKSIIFGEGNVYLFHEKSWTYYSNNKPINIANNQ